MICAQTKTRPQLVYLVFGAETYHQEAVFSIASALAWLRETPDAAIDIQVFSDNPQPYEHLPVRIRPLDAETRQKWSEPHGYHFRIKHVALRSVLEEHEMALLIDTDTFFHCSPLKLFERVQPGILLCNDYYARYGDNKTSLLYRTLSATLLDKGLTDDHMRLLNSGVIGLHRQDAHVLDRSIALIDELFPSAQGAYTLEEFCLSVAAYRTLDVNKCPDLIHHYWSRKHLFRAKVQAWVAKHGDNPTGEAALDDTRRVSPQLPRPPRLQRMFYKLVTLLLPAHLRQFMREILYGCYEHPNEFDQACAAVWWDKALENQQHRIGKPVCRHLLRDWFSRGLVKRILGSRHAKVHQHLLKTASK